MGYLKRPNVFFCAIIFCSGFAFLLLGVLQGTHASAQGLESRAQTELSQIRGTIQIAGLENPVTVLRDRWGVAHIYAANQHDLFFAQGYVVSQDRLFQMELWKRSGQGRLAEILGPSALQRDVNARLLRYTGNMDAEYASYSADTKEILQAFTDGINAYIAERTRPGGRGLPIEFQIAGFKPEPWRPEDCLNRMAAFSMTGNSTAELYHAQAVAALGATRATRLFAFDPAVELDPAPGVDFAGLSPQLLRNLVGSDTRIEFPAHALQGSNDWTISGALTASGKPIVANDPHRVIAEPSLRYVIHLVAPGWDVIGAGEPGLPGVAVGHNQNIAWGFTIFGLDQQDLYLEKLNPANPLEYKTERGWARMRVEKETFRVRGEPSVVVDLKFTRHGPVLWEDKARALALRWVGAEPGTAGYLGSLAVDRAQNWQQFEEAVKSWKVPSENLAYGDRAGNIGEYSVGLAPIRKNWYGLLPVPGDGGYEWRGFIPTKDLPHSFNPAAGFVATANHKMIPSNYPYRVGYEWAPGFRFRRISAVLEAAKSSGHKLTVADMENLQNDVFSTPALELIGVLRQAAGTSSDPDVRLLLGWNGAVTRQSGAAALYEVWLQDVTDAVTHRIVPADLWGLTRDWPVTKVLDAVVHPAPDVFGPEPEQARNRLLLDTLKSAHEKLTALEGPDPSKWAWERIHVVEFLHPLDQAPGVKKLFDLGPIPRPGDDYTVNATGFWAGGYKQVAGASYREIMDLGDWDNSVAVNVPGQSGQPGSPHYSDLLPLWSEGRYFPLSYSRTTVAKYATDKLVLEPK
ncbi:MAG TPA: penicillin acylase family protein [Candidatus Acidoferrum sp.]|nr:penicillin acylase family protein [Candidatus Acidoferrum sp.]